MKALSSLFLVFSGFLICSCNEPNKTEISKEIDYQKLKDPLIVANKKYIKKEDDEIDQYVKRHQWNMNVSGTGIRYMIYKEGKGKPAKIDNYVKVKYKISLLDGTLCYSSDELGDKEFLIGQDHVESGLHEALQYMKVGDKALFILPSHLAHGLLGDEKKIPPQSAVLYDIELLSLR